MQQDFHYYAIGILARAAGFNPADALVIATASQYVDDATESERIPIQVNGATLQFDPVLTAYKKLDALKSIERAQILFKRAGNASSNFLG